MTKLLLDTITLDWLLHQPDKIPVSVRQDIQDADEVIVSAASFWEMANHVRAGILVLKTPFEQYFKEALLTYQLSFLPLTWEAFDYLSRFDYQIIQKPYQRVGKDGRVLTGFKPELHKDTFDRMIIAHALTLQVPIASPDQLFPHYKSMGLNVIW